MPRNDLMDFTHTNPEASFVHVIEICIQNSIFVYRSLGSYKMTLEIIKIMGFLSFCSKRFEFACRIFRVTIKKTLRPYMAN
jgi:hypothetical protein